MGWAGLTGVLVSSSRDFDEVDSSVLSEPFDVVEGVNFLSAIIVSHARSLSETMSVPLVLLATIETNSISH